MLFTSVEFVLDARMKTWSHGCRVSTFTCINSSVSCLFNNFKKNVLLVLCLQLQAATSVILPSKRQYNKISHIPMPTVQD